jgi:hypothetical protein
MRRYTLDLLKTLSSQQGGGEMITEKEVIHWANDKVLNTIPSAIDNCLEDQLSNNGPRVPIKNLNDKILSDGIFLLRICAAIKPK